MATTFTLLGATDSERFTGLLSTWHAADGTAFDSNIAGAAISRLLIDSHPGHTWLIESGTEAIGYLVLSLNDSHTEPDPRAYVSALYLASGWRRKGFGAKASLFVQEVARWLKVRVLAFEIATERKHAQVLYRSSARTFRPQSYRHEAVA